MKFLIGFVIGVSLLLFTSGTVVDNQPVDQKIVPVVMDIQISEYPGPFLSMGGRLKYHVLINGRIVGMHDEDAHTILSIFKIPAYTPEQFHELGLDNQIWAFERSGKGFAKNLVSARTR